MEGDLEVRFTETDLLFLAGAVADDDERITAALVRAWQADPAAAEEHLADDRVLRRLTSDQRAVVELSPRFLFAALLSRIRWDLGEIPYTVERVHADGRVVVFDARAAYDLLRSRELFYYLVEMLVSFERVETVTVRRLHPPSVARRLSTMSIEDMLELARLVEPEMRATVFRRIGDIALFTTGIFPESVLRRRRVPLGAVTEAPPRWRPRMEDYEAEGRRFYRLAADRLTSQEPALARVLMRLAEEFTAARKPLNVLSERYVAWARPHWRLLPS